MKLREILVLAMLLVAAACDQKEIATPVVQPSNERRGGNGNGNGGNNQTTDPCANYPVYPIVNQAPTDWNIRVDTTICGSVIFRWDAQPGFNPVTDTCFTIARYYYISFAPVGHTNGCVGGGSISSTNSYYYTLGAGCSIWPGFKYTMGITYYERNTQLQKTFVRASNAVEFTAGTRAPWLNNCN